MKKFEYRLEKIDLKGGFFGRIRFNDSDLNDLLNSLGANGWELVSCSPSSREYGRSDFLLFVFKREIEN